MWSMMNDLHEVIFQWPYTQPKSVIVTGSFDKWRSSIPLIKGRNGFEAKVQVPWGQKVPYKFIVDGRWSVRPGQPTEYDNVGNLNNVYTSPPRPAKPPLPSPYSYTDTIKNATTIDETLTPTNDKEDRKESEDKVPEGGQAAVEREHDAKEVPLNEFHNKQAASPGDVVGIPDGESVVAPIVPITIVRVNAPEHNTVPREPSSPTVEDQEPEKDHEREASVVSDVTVVDEVEANGKPTGGIEEVILNLGQPSEPVVSPPEVVVVTPPVEDEVVEDKVVEPVSPPPGLSEVPTSDTPKDEPVTSTTEPAAVVDDAVPEVTETAEAPVEPVACPNPNPEPVTQPQPIEPQQDQTEEEDTTTPTPDGAAEGSAPAASETPVPVVDSAEPVKVEEPAAETKEVTEDAKVEENGDVTPAPIAEPTVAVVEAPAAATETQEPSPPAETPAEPAPPAETPAAPTPAPEPTATPATPNGTLKSGTTKSKRGLFSGKSLRGNKSHKHQPSAPLDGLPNGHGGVANGNGTLKGHGRSKSAQALGSEFGVEGEDDDSKEGVKGVSTLPTRKRKRSFWAKLKDVFKNEKKEVVEVVEAKA